MPVTKEQLDEIALSRKEYDLIVQKLGREPTEVELGMFGALWSEHCGYKHSRALLKYFPSKGKRVKTKVGEENAGAVDIGDGYIIVFKMESHNHPSAIEPTQGAATGVGGIVRDIFTMGARPIALMNSLRFGPLDNDHNRFLLNGVVGGIASYGNCLGIPDIGGEIYFADCYSGNPLVNAFCLGIAKSDSLISARASGEGNLLMLVGADTGRDGLHGASGLASRTFEHQGELRSAVQVGNPFLEKLLIEACLELAKTDWIVGMQDLGAAGLTSSSVESASKGGSGIFIDVLKAPRREKAMNAYEVMLSESQERMLVVVKKGHESKVKGLFDKWGLQSDVIGHVTGDGMATIAEGDKIVASAPVAILNSPPVYRSRPRKPTWIAENQAFQFNAIKDLSLKKIKPVLLHLLQSPNIASKHAVYRQYDHQVGNSSVVLPGSDAAVLRIPGTKKAIAMTSDGNGRYCYINPFIGGVITVAEAARNLACSGATPIAMTNCLNFGNPEKNDVAYQMRECIKGMAHACRELKVPVISGNVSLYNESKNEAIYPTPVTGMVGLIEDAAKHCSQGFKKDGDIVYLLGKQEYNEAYLSGSEYLEVIHGIVKGDLTIDLSMEKAVQQCCIELISKNIILSAHDCSDGGLLVCLAECCMPNKIGFSSKDFIINGRIDAALFGEAQSRIVVSADPKQAAKLDNITRKWKVPFTKLGTTGGMRFTIKGYTDIALDDVEQAWKDGLTRRI